MGPIPSTTLDDQNLPFFRTNQLINDLEPMVQWMVLTTVTSKKCHPTDENNDDNNNNNKHHIRGETYDTYNLNGSCPQITHLKAMIDTIFITLALKCMVIGKQNACERPSASLFKR